MAQSTTLDTARPGHWLTMRSLWLWCWPIGLFINLSINTVAPDDFWWHVRTGQLILQSRTIPTIDLFSYTQTGATWINQAWLMQVWLALLMAWGGIPLVLFFHAVSVVAGYTLILRACAQRYGVRTSVWATFLGALVGAQNWAVRPQTISFLAFGLLIFLIEAHRQGRRRMLWWAAPLFAFWVNAHGVFVFGLAALGLYVVGTLWDCVWRREWQTRRSEMLELSAQGLLAVAALSLNPQGPIGMFTYVLGFFQSEVTVKYNVEFASLTIRQPDGIFFALSILLLFIARLNSTTRLSTAQTLMLFTFALMTLFSRRSAAWFGMVQIPILAAYLRGWWRMPWPLPPGKPLITGAIFALLLLFTLAVLPWWRPYLPQLLEERPLLAPYTPVEATAFLCEQFTPGTRGYQAIAFASYMEEACPDLPVFIDTRFELYPTAQWEEYLAMYNGRYDWAMIAERYNMDYLFVYLKEQPNLVNAATAHEGWEEIYRDDRAVIFERIAR